MIRIELSEDDLALLDSALRLAADKYRDFAADLSGDSAGLRLEQAFSRQAEQAETIRQKFEDA